MYVKLLPLRLRPSLFGCVAKAKAAQNTQLWVRRPPCISSPPTRESLKLTPDAATGKNVRTAGCVLAPKLNNSVRCCSAHAFRLESICEGNESQLLDAICRKHQNLCVTQRHVRPVVHLARRS